MFIMTIIAFQTAAIDYLDLIERVGSSCKDTSFQKAMAITIYKSCVLLSCLKNEAATLQENLRHWQTNPCDHEWQRTLSSIQDQLKKFLSIQLQLDLRCLQDLDTSITMIEESLKRLDQATLNFLLELNLKALTIASYNSIPRDFEILFTNIVKPKRGLFSEKSKEIINLIDELSKFYLRRSFEIKKEEQCQVRLRDKAVVIVKNFHQIDIESQLVLADIRLYRANCKHREWTRRIDKVIQMLEEFRNPLKEFLSDCIEIKKQLPKEKEDEPDVRLFTELHSKAREIKQHILGLKIALLSFEKSLEVAPLDFPPLSHFFVSFDRKIREQAIKPSWGGFV